ncbi:hypothetical protein EVAR_3910_1 [Eumeta japonica]|uniref:Uncharacterized protein n=1 Tax=Eumeta variegata TaxID=151549 RepID=A0A4C1SQW7_EUMVA|nr:hypothetical protein EVAR_3910_1 [Eumeta japonica]
MIGEKGASFGGPATRRPRPPPRLQSSDIIKGRRIKPKIVLGSTSKGLPPAARWNKNCYRTGISVKCQKLNCQSFGLSQYKNRSVINSGGRGSAGPNIKYHFQSRPNLSVQKEPLNYRNQSSDSAVTQKNENKIFGNPKSQGGQKGANKKNVRERVLAKRHL